MHLRFLLEKNMNVRVCNCICCSGKKKDNTEENKAAERFYGVPKSCSELETFGYTLNGYYLVNGTASSHHIEISLCKFQQPLAANESKYTISLLHIIFMKSHLNEMTST